MRKSEFLYELRRALSGLPQSDVEERISFYSEMIDDRMEEGPSEEEVVAGIGSPHDVAEQIKADLRRQIRKTIKKRRKTSGIGVPSRYFSSFWPHRLSSR